MRKLEVTPSFSKEDLKVPGSAYVDIEVTAVVVILGVLLFII